MRSILGIAGNLLSIFSAVFLCKPLGHWIFQTFVRQNFIQDIQQKLGDSTASSGFVKLTYDLTGMIPSFISNSLFQGKSSTELAKEILSEENAQNAAQKLTDEILAPITTFIIVCICFFALYILLRILLRVIFKLTGCIEHIPILGQLNGLLGAGVGIVSSFIFLSLLGTFVYFLIFSTSNSLSWLNYALVENTNLFFLFYKLNFLHML